VIDTIESYLGGGSNGKSCTSSLESESESV
jgi:hypothetical protein